MRGFRDFDGMTAAKVGSTAAFAESTAAEYAVTWGASAAPALDVWSRRAPKCRPANRIALNHSQWDCGECRPSSGRRTKNLGQLYALVGCSACDIGAYGD